MSRTLIATLNPSTDTATYTLTGTGGGAKRYIAEITYPNEESFDSSTVEVLDCIYYIVNSYNLYKTLAVTVTPNTDSVTFSASGNYGLIFLSEDNSFVEGCFAFEFKLMSFSSGDINIRCGSATSSSLQRSLSQIGATTGDIIRLENGNGVVHFYVNDVLSPQNRGNSGTIKYGFNIPENESITVTDMKLYPLYDNSVSTISISASEETIISSETSTLTITPKGENGYPVRNVDIGLYQDNILVDTLNTGNTGKATYTYTGTGTGKVGFVAKYDTIQSTVMEIFDCLFYDNCTSADHNDSIWSENPSLDFNRTTEYTEISLKQDTTSGTTYMTGLSPYYVIDFDYHQVDGSVGNGFFNIYSNSASLTWFSLGNIGLSYHLGQWVSLRLELTSNSATLTYRDDPTKTLTKTFTGTPTRLRFPVGSTAITKMRLRNIRVYPI